MDAPPSGPPRGLYYLAGAAVAAFSLAEAYLAWTAGKPWTAAATGLSGAVFVAGVALALSTPRFRLGADLSDPGQAVAFLVVGFALYLVFGLGVLGTTVGNLELLAAGQRPEDVLQITRAGLLAGVLVNTIVFLAPAAAWAALVEARAGPALRWLGVTGQRLEESLALGILVVLGIFGALILISLLLLAGGVAVPENTLALSIGRAVDLPLAVVLAVLSSVGEEIFFRGFVQAKLGVFRQGVLFAAAHATYLNVPEILGTLALGLGFGWVRKRTGNIAGPVAGHLMFNLTMLLVLIYAQRAGQSI